MLLIGMFVLGAAATIFGLSASRLPLDKIARATSVTMTADEIGPTAPAAFAGAIGPRARPVHPPRLAARGRQRQRRRSIHRGECRGTRPRRLSDLDITRAAHLLIRRQGDDATSKAREKVDEMRSKGD